MVDSSLQNLVSLESASFSSCLDDDNDETNDYYSSVFSAVDNNNELLCRQRLKIMLKQEESNYLCSNYLDIDHYYRNSTRQNGRRTSKRISKEEQFVNECALLVTDYTLQKNNYHHNGNESLTMKTPRQDNHKTNNDNGKTKGLSIMHTFSSSWSSFADLLNLAENSPTSTSDTTHITTSTKTDDVVSLESDATINNEEDITVSSTIQAQHHDQQLTSSSQEDYQCFDDKNELMLKDLALWREKMIHWSYTVIDTFSIDKSIVTFAFSMFDRYMAKLLLSLFDLDNGSVCDIKQDDIQLYCMTCLFISIKCFSDSENKLFIDDFVDMSKGYYTENDLMETERDILCRLGFYLNSPTTYCFLNSILSFTVCRKQQQQQQQVKNKTRTPSININNNDNDNDDSNRNNHDNKIERKQQLQQHSNCTKENNPKNDGVSCNDILTIHNIVENVEETLSTILHDSFFIDKKPSSIAIAIVIFQLQHTSNIDSTSNRNVQLTILSDMLVTIEEHLSTGNNSPIMDDRNDEIDCIYNHLITILDVEDESHHV